MRRLTRRITASAIAGILGAALTGTAEAQLPTPAVPVTPSAAAPLPALDGLGPRGSGPAAVPTGASAAAPAGATSVSGPPIGPAPNPTDSFVRPPGAGVAGPPEPSVPFLTEV